MRKSEGYLITEFSTPVLYKDRDPMYELWIKEGTRPFAALTSEHTWCILMTSGSKKALAYLRR